MDATRRMWHQTPGPWAAVVALVLQLLPTHDSSRSGTLTCPYSAPGRE